MIAETVKTHPAPISAIALVAGFALIVSGYEPWGVAAGAALTLLAFFVPFIRLSHLPRTGETRRAELGASPSRSSILRVNLPRTEQLTKADPGEEQSASVAKDDPIRVKAWVSDGGHLSTVGAARTEIGAGETPVMTVDILNGSGEPVHVTAETLREIGIALQDVAVGQDLDDSIRVHVTIAPPEHDADS